MSAIKDFQERRTTGNEALAKYATSVQKKFYGLDVQTYSDGALDVKTKELLGLVASLVLRCDDCILYHAINCKNEGITSEELSEAIAVAQIVGGSITIPHTRRLLQAWDEELVDAGHKAA